MRYILSTFISVFFCLTAMAQQNMTLLSVFEQSGGTQTATYQEGMQLWRSLSEQSHQLSGFRYGETDAGYPLTLMVWSENGTFNPEELRAQGKQVFLINNAIHPGEPDGVEASFMLIRDILANKDLQKKYEDIVICIIPYYNIGGSLNRNSHSRANQNGPEEYGFRGNAKNYDLNRDFVKMDSKNAFAFAEIFHQWKPLVFYDNHVSNGADYQYTLTYLATQEDKLGKVLGEEQRRINKYMSDQMKAKGTPVIPYVNVWGRAPDDGGIKQFYDAPRYSSGYAALFQCLSYTVETHMLKPFEDRVKQTYDFMQIMLDLLSKEGKDILKKQKEQTRLISQSDSLAVNWTLDESKNEMIDFQGYEMEMISSEVSGQERMFYNKEKPFTKKIPYYGTYTPTTIIAKPKYYVLPAVWENIAERLGTNGVRSIKLESDTVIEVEVIYIENYETAKSPFEGHYFHNSTTTRRETQSIKFLAGDHLIPMEGNPELFLMSVLEPEASDSYFNWNFFDIYLQQKEGYSPYVFEDKAAEYLKNDPELKAEFERMKEETPGFAKNGQWQLYWIYQQSPHAEPEYMRMPVFRIN